MIKLTLEENDMIMELTINGEADITIMETRKGEWVRTDKLTPKYARRGIRKLKQMLFKLVKEQTPFKIEDVEAQHD